MTANRRLAGGLLAAGLAVVALAVAASAQARLVVLREYRVDAARMATLRQHWVDQLTARYPAQSWAPMRMELSDADLHLMGLPPRRVLLAHRYRVPTALLPSGRMVRLGPSRKGGGSGGSGGSGSSGSPGVVTYAGAGFFGIRPGAWLLLLNGGSVGWCSMAHVYGTPGAYQISTAGHCGKPGDVATVIGAVGNHSTGGATVPFLLDFGTFKTVHDAGLGHDWALISVASQYQSLVTPTMAFWGGPIGMYTSQGQLLNVSLTGRNPGITPDPNPALVQQLVHYGHGVGVGAGGTPRSGTAISWAADHFMFFGAISPGDSGSGANTLTGDAAGDNREAAGIMTHLWIDPLMREGVGIMGGTRATQVAAPLANGQLLPYPAPTPIPLP
jgi:hypothetical protein